MAALSLRAAAGPPEWTYRPKGNYAGHTDRPLRYWPVGTDFVITNGPEFFNRPLYCANTAFRVDGGDKPEFSLYLPGRGGNLRFGIKTAAGVKWLNDAEQIVACYRPGSLLYTIRDPLLGGKDLDLAVLPLGDRKGFIARVELKCPNETGSPQLILAFGGANGMKGRRGGDIGCESEPVSQFFQLKPEECRDNAFTISSNTFVLRSQTATIQGTASVGAKWAVGDAMKWNNAEKLLVSERRSPDRLSDPSSPKGASPATGAPFPIVVGEMALFSNQPVYLALKPSGDDAPAVVADGLPELFSAAEEHRRVIADSLTVDTPDPFINAAVPALCVAADAIWDKQQQSFMHGAVAWRVRLLGWRGPYAGDELGWHDRTAAHFAGYARQQNTNPVPDRIPPADEDANLARNEAALHSNGDLTKSHYDMNLVGVDAFFRHLLWTGDLDYARQMWPVIERHLAWERRLFRREFGPDKLPLYEAYAAIWASDNLNYNGGGAAHASAYNYWHNKMAARVSRCIGRDPTPYEQEAELILRAMQKYLWLPDEGTFAEFKDYLGLQQVHPNAGLWTFYTTIDSEVPKLAQAERMSRWVDENIAHIPIQSPGSSRGNEAQTENAESEEPKAAAEQRLPATAAREECFTLPTTSWMPYQWSLNNVVMAEAAHTSLAYWQVNRPETAFALFKGCLLDSMYLGLCPGNLGAMTHFDMARGEAQRDFGDSIGITSRALVEGLFGVRPDVLAGELKIAPGFPAAWDHASLRHPDFDLSFRRESEKDTWIINQRFSPLLALNLQLTAPRDEVDNVTINGKSGKWLWPRARLEIRNPPAAHTEIVVTWKGKDLPAGEPPQRTAAMATSTPATDWTAKLPSNVKLETVDLARCFNDQVTQIFRNQYRSPRSPFCSLALPEQGLGGWADNKQAFDVDDSGLRAAAVKAGGKFMLPNGVPFRTPTNPAANNIVFTSQWDNYPPEATVPLAGKAAHLYLLMAGSTGPMQSRFDNGEVLVTYADGATDRLALNNPLNWWPVDQDYFIDDYAFRRPEPIPPRVDLKTGRVRILDVNEFKGRGGAVPGGAATILDLPLNPGKELKSLTIRALANEVVIGLMAVTLER